MSAANVVSIALSVLALLIAVATCIYQVREMHRQTIRFEAQLEGATTDSLRSTFEGMSRAFLDYPYLRLVFYPNELEDDSAATMPLTMDDRLRAATICEDLLDAFEHVFDAERDQRFHWTAKCWNYFDDLMTQSDFLYQYLSKHQTWWPNALYERAKSVRDALTPDQV